jgi:chromosomal replication initiation ATPase DnaA
MVEANEQEKEIIYKVEKIVCKFFNVTEQDVLNHNHKRDSSMARGFIWYILHYDYEMSATKIANTYYRVPRSVKSLISKTKYSIKKQSMYRKIYHAFKDALHLR